MNANRLIKMVIEESSAEVEPGQCLISSKVIRTCQEHLEEGSEERMTVYILVARETEDSEPFDRMVRGYIGRDVAVQKAQRCNELARALLGKQSEISSMPMPRLVAHGSSEISSMTYYMRMHNLRTTDEWRAMKEEDPGICMAESIEYVVETLEVEE